MHQVPHPLQRKLRTRATRPMSANGASYDDRRVANIRVYRAPVDSPAQGCASKSKRTSSPISYSFVRSLESSAIFSAMSTSRKWRRSA